MSFAALIGTNTESSTPLRSYRFQGNSSPTVALKTCLHARSSERRVFCTLMYLSYVLLESWRTSRPLLAASATSRSMRAFSEAMKASLVMPRCLASKPACSSSLS